LYSDYTPLKTSHRYEAQLLLTRNGVELDLFLPSLERYPKDFPKKSCSCPNLGYFQYLLNASFKIPSTEI
jgi:hypothetical protein